MILGRREAQLESTQPEEQHGFPSGRRVDEHLVTTQVLLDKLLRANVPIWITGLDLSKAFDRVSWPALWRALSQQALSNLGLDLRDGGPDLLDFRFADDILIFGTSYHVIGVLFDKFVENLAAVGLQLNVDKTKILTSQAQPPQ